MPLLMLYLTFIAAVLLYLDRTLAQSFSGVACSMLIGEVVEVPAALCNPGSCNACTGSTIPDLIMDDEFTFVRFVNNLMYSLDAGDGSYVNWLLSDDYKGDVRLLIPEINDNICLQATDVTNLLNEFGYFVDQVDSILGEGDRFRALVGDSVYEEMARMFVQDLRDRVYRSGYILWLGQACTDLTLLSQMNDKIEAFSAKYPEFSQMNGVNRVPLLHTPCRPIISYSSVPSACPASACRAAPVSDSVCSSCDLPAESLSAYQSDLDAAASSHTAAVAYATLAPSPQLETNPFEQSVFVQMIQEGQAKVNEAISIVSQNIGCLNMEQSRAVLSAMTSYVESSTWLVTQYSIIEGPGDWDNMFDTYLGMGPTGVLVRPFSGIMQARLSNPSSCFDCNDVAAYNAALTTFQRVFAETMTITGRYRSITLGDMGLLSLDCTTCPISSSILSSSTEVSSEPSALSSFSSVSSSLESSASFESSSFGSSSSPSSSLESVPSVPSSFYSQSSVQASSFLDSILPQSSSLAPSQSSLQEASSQASISPSKEQSASAFTANAPSFGYSNSSSTAISLRTTASTGEATVSDKADPELTLSTPTTSAGSAGSTRTFTTTLLITEPCAKCPGGSTIFTTTLVTEQCDAGSATAMAADSTRTFTTTSLITEPCSKCIGGITTFTTTSLVTEPCDTHTIPAYPESPESPKAPASPGSPKPSETTNAILAEGTTAPTVTGVVTKTAAATGSVSAVALPSQVSQTSVVAANTGNMKAWRSLLLLLLPAVLGV